MYKEDQFTVIFGKIGSATFLSRFMYVLENLSTITYKYNSCFLKEVKTVIEINDDIFGKMIRAVLKSKRKVIK